MRKVIWMFISACLLFSGITWASDLTARDAKILKEAGIPLYNEAEFLNGGLGDAVMGARFASSAPAKDVRDFYRAKFPSWALYSEHGNWILYEGKPGKSPAAAMGKKQISVADNSNLPEWFGVPDNMTTEILIVVPPVK